MIRRLLARAWSWRARVAIRKARRRSSYASSVWFRNRVRL